MCRTNTVGVPPARPFVSWLLTQVLTHPVIVGLKRPLRDEWWALRGASLCNPPIPSHVDSVLFVCLGNICRSPFAARRALARFVEAGDTRMQCLSAGLRPSQAARSPREACQMAAAYGLTLDDHKPRPLTAELMASDLIVVMDTSQLQRLREEYPECGDRLFLLALLDVDGRGAYERHNIEDPFGQPLAAYDACYRRIDRALGKLVAATARQRSN